MMTLTLAIAASLTAAAPSSVASMRWEKRVLIVAAPAEGAASLGEQRRILQAWHAGAADRDLAVVAIVGDTVTGASDTAATLRRRYRIAADGFAAILIGKDGGIKLRSARPITAETLEATIDAMPMRAAGGH